MDELLSPEKRAFRARIRAILEREVEPHREAVERGERFPEACFPALREKGVFAGRLPREHGGAGLSNIDAAIAAVELARVDTAVTMASGASAILCGGAIGRHGNEAQRGRWLKQLADGTALGAWGLTEPGAGSDVAGMQTRAVRDGKHWVLTGQKTFITNAPRATVFVVYARTSDETDDPHRGISSFILERGDAGLETGPPMKKLGMHGSPTGEVFLDRCKIPEDRLLGSEGLGFYHAVEVLNDERAGLPAIGCGIARRALDDAWAVLGRAGPHADTLARGEAKLLRCLAQLFVVCEARDQGEEDPAAASALKLAAGDMAVSVALDCMRVLGTAGADSARAAERALRDAKLLTIGGGTSEIQKTLIARRLFAV